MKPALRLLALAAALTLGACSSGETTVSGVDAEATGETTPGTGPTGTGPTAPTGATSVTGSPGGFDGAVSLDIPASKNPTGAAMYSCEGIEGTWIYEPGELSVQGLKFTLAAEPVDMGGGNGTLVIEGTIEIPGAGTAGFVDTIDLEIEGSASAPAMTSNGVKVDVTGALEGIPFDIAEFFPENASFPIVAGAAQC